jgi:hypothetical protein
MGEQVKRETSMKQAESRENPRAGKIRLCRVGRKLQDNTSALIGCRRGTERTNRKQEKSNCSLPSKCHGVQRFVVS